MGIALISVAQLAVSILLAAIAAYLGLWLFERATKGIDEWDAIRQGNTAIGLTLAAIVIGLAIILLPAVSGALPASSGRFAPDMAPNILPIYMLGLMLLRALLGLVLGTATILFSVWLFTRLTRDIDEMKELEKGNNAVAAMLSGVIIAIALLVSPVVTGITNQLLPVLWP